MNSEELDVDFNFEAAIHAMEPHWTSWRHIWTSNAWRHGHFRSLRITWGATEWYPWIWSLNDEMLIEAVNSINQESWMPWGQCWGQPNCFSAFWTSWHTTWSTTITVTFTSRCYIQKCKSFQSSGWSTAPGNWAEPVQCINQEKHQMGRWRIQWYASLPNKSWKRFPDPTQWIISFDIQFTLIKTWPFPGQAWKNIFACSPYIHLV